MHDWHTMHDLLSLYLRKQWKFTAVAARFALEGCWRSSPEKYSEDTVVLIWRSLLRHDATSEHCVLQLLNIRKRFADADKVETLLRELLCDDGLTAHKLQMAIVDEILEVAHAHRLLDITRRVAAHIVHSESNLFSVSNCADIDETKLKIMRKLLCFFVEITDVDGALVLFAQLKRFRRMSMAATAPHNERAWQRQLVNAETLPLFMQVVSDHFLRQVSVDQSSEAQLCEYRAQAEALCSDGFGGSVFDSVFERSDGVGQCAVCVAGAETLCAALEQRTVGVRRASVAAL